MKLGNPIEGQQYSRGQLGLGTLVISLFLFGSIICKMMHYSLFLKVLPHGPDVACWLISRLGDCLSSLHLPSFAWKLWPSASRPWKELTSVSCISLLCSGPQLCAE